MLGPGLSMRYTPIAPHIALEHPIGEPFYFMHLSAIEKLVHSMKTPPWPSLVILPLSHLAKVGTHNTVLEFDFAVPQDSFCFDNDRFLAGVKYIYPEALGLTR